MSELPAGPSDPELPDSLQSNSQVFWPCHHHSHTAQLSFPSASAMLTQYLSKTGRCHCLLEGLHDFLSLLSCQLLVSLIVPWSMRCHGEHWASIPSATPKLTVVEMYGRHKGGLAEMEREGQAAILSWGLPFSGQPGGALWNELGP